jgi:hypothetical protein
MTLPNWSAIRDEFIFDGALLDLYVLGTTVWDWTLLLRTLGRTGYRLTFQSGGKVEALPGDAQSLFQSREPSHLLKIDVSGIQVICHFFADEEIEFDVDPREVDGQERLDALIGFLVFLSRTLGKEAILTPENFREKPILRVLPPDGIVEYLSFPRDEQSGIK